MKRADRQAMVTHLITLYNRAEKKSVSEHRNTSDRLQKQSTPGDYSQHKLTETGHL